MNTLILLAAVAVGQPPATSPAPPVRLAVPPPATFHSPAPVAAKGDVKAGPPLVHTFDLVHNGTGTVTITKIEAGCGCLRQSLGTTTLQPGERTKLALEVNTLTQPDGPNRWQITVGYKVEAPGVAAQTGELLLQVTATLSRDISVNPPQVAFSSTGAVSQAIVVTDKRAKPLTVLKAASSSQHLTVEVAPAANATPGQPRAQSVTIKLAATAPAGHRDEIVVLYTDDAGVPGTANPCPGAETSRGGCDRDPGRSELAARPGRRKVRRWFNFGRPMARR